MITALMLSACATPRYYHGPAGTGEMIPATQRPYTVNGKRYEPIANEEGFVQTGIASWYGKDFHGKRTSNGEIYNMNAMTAAHKTLPLGVYVKVTNLRNHRTAIVRVNDRGPFVKGRIIDLSYAAAKRLGVDVAGTAPVRIEAMGYREPGGGYRQPASYDSGVYTVQIGSFREYANASRLSSTMKRRYGFSDVRRTNVNGDVYYRVYAGKYSSESAAERAEREFGDQGFSGSFAVGLD